MKILEGTTASQLYTAISRYTNRFWRGFLEASIWDRLVYILYTMMTVLIVYLVIFSHIQGQLYYVRHYDEPQVALLAIGMAMLFIVALISKVVGGNSKHVRIKLILATVVLFVVQLFMIRAMLFQTGWDVGEVVSTADLLASSGYSPEQYTTDYFNVNSNNRLLLILIAEFLRIMRRMGIVSGAVQYQTLVILQAILYDAAGLLMFALVHSLSSSYRAAWFAWIIYAVWIGLSPWILITYTDSCGIIFPVLLLWMYQHLQDRSYIVRWTVLGIVGGFAYQIKATNAILLIAMAFIEIAHRFRIKREILLKTIIAGAVLCVMVGGSKFLGDLAYEYVTGVEIDSDRDMGMLHYFDMGLNEDSVGTFNFQDDEESMWARTREERNRQNLSKAISRIEDMGPLGVTRQYLRKTKVNFNDGSFGFALDGTDFIMTDYATRPVSEDGIDDGRFTAVETGIRSIWRPDGTHFNLYLDADQGLWLALLVLLIPSGWLCIRNRDYSVLFLTLIGAWMFTMLFEGQQRYLFIFAPLFLIAAICGLQKIVHKLHIS